MGYEYSLSISSFKAEDNEACLKAIRDVEPDIGDYMEIIEDEIHFYPDDSYGKWRNAEDAAIAIIMEQIFPGTTCAVYWQGEDGEMGGELIVRGHCYQIAYKETVVTDYGDDIPLHEATKMLAAMNTIYKSTWVYPQHGEHAYFLREDWRDTVVKGDTVLGYQQWVEHNLESLLYKTSLEGVDAIEVAGCTDADGIVEVKSEEDAEFFSVYTHKQDEGVVCVCDFNTKSQAIEFAKALAARTGIPVYGNLCSIEVPK